MTKFTKEQLQQIAQGGCLKNGEAEAMARQLLASMGQEPVYQVWDWHWYDAEKHIYDEAKARGEECRILYAAPQLPQPAVPETVPESLKDKLLTICDLVEDNDEYCQDIWNACRAAMLHGAEPVRPTNKLRDGWVAVPVEPTEEMLDEFDSIIDYGAEDSKDAWSRLIAAAPQQEVNP